jgi:D-serine deaminase-like pyridoxal phosphate-dependent protein
MSSVIGIARDQIETPALLIDLDALAKNIETMASYYRRKKGAALMPHQKGHRLPAIAKKQIDAGAKGVCSTSLSLADFYVNCGIENILVTAEVSGSTKISRLVGLCKQANVTATVDDIENVRQLSEAALGNRTKVNVAVELYMGRGSAGVQLDKTKAFVKEMHKFRGVNFRGLWWHEGALAGVKSFEERRRLEFEIMEQIVRVRDEIEDAGISVEMLSGGFTATWNITPEFPGLINVGVQAGSYVFSDWVSHLIEGIEVFDCALTVLTHCISRPTPSEAIFDSGMNSCSSESGENYHSVVGPRFKDLNDVKTVFQREELMEVVFDGPNTSVRVADIFELIPPHSDTTAKLHDRYYGMRNDRVEVVWANLGRGRF